MIITTENNQTVLTPSKGYVLCNPDKTSFTVKAYLGSNDKPENYIEITENQYYEIQLEDKIKNDENDRG